MQTMLNRIVIITSRIFGQLPFSVIYGFSNVLFLVLYYVAGYRKKVVTQNLHRSFPGKTPKEINLIRRQYYRYFADLLLESLKGLYMKEAEFRKRFTWADPHVFDEEIKGHKHIIMLGSHYGNWEWGSVCMPLYLHHQLYGIYKPLSNKALDNWLQERRSRFGLLPVKMSQVARTLVQEHDALAMFAFIADQTPVDVENAFWLRFLNQDTPFYHGPEKLARRTGFPVYIYKIERPKRGFYSISFHKLTDDARSLPEGELTKRYVAFLERQISEAPQYWLWSHRRWKRSKPANASVFR
ncbi:MAG: lipid A biosynthesis acyltransferase [Saprospirales bacterium]|nr:lipid A biosynthesis acyltransferase [Saprospirales bacterium]